MVAPHGSRLDRVDEHVDWRRVTGDSSADVASDFEQADKSVTGAWEDVVDYLESHWSEHLLTPSP